MKIYIASSWRNQHGVEMLTALLRQRGHEVISWIENNFGEIENIKKLSFDQWLLTDGARCSFEFDTEGVKNCDLLIYYGPAGMDACAEMGIAYALAKPILGLWAKGEELGLMRKMVIGWFSNYLELVAAVNQFAPDKPKNPYADYGNTQAPHPMDYESKEEFQEKYRKWKAWEEQQGQPVLLT